MCRLPSGFPGALFLLSGLASLTELLPSLAFGESPVCNEKFLFHPALFGFPEIISFYRVAFQ